MMRAVAYIYEEYQLYEQSLVILEKKIKKYKTRRTTIYTRRCEYIKEINNHLESLKKFKPNY